MNESDRPLWQLLLDIKTAVHVERPLTCQECFSVLEYLAETLGRETAVAHQDELHEKIKQHLAVCPNCQAYYQARLAEMERLLPPD